MPADEMDVTAILRAHGRGEPGATDALFERVYDDLSRIAHRQLARNAARPLDTTSLVHELFLKLVNQDRVEWQDRAHFFGVAARAMRQVIVDFARRVTRKKRGAGRPDLTLEDVETHADAEQILDVAIALDRLEELEPRLARIVELRFFAGLSEAEAARALGVSPRTAQREWVRAKALLHGILAPRPHTEDGP